LNNTYEIVFQKVSELLDETGDQATPEVSGVELDELEELRRFSAELQESAPISMTSTV
jgi:hypothetical protein